MLNKRLYKVKNKIEIKEEMLSKQAYISSSDIPYGWSTEAASFFNRLLERNPEYRLGNKGIYELKQHEWLRDISWEQLIKKQLEAPFIPESKYNYDIEHCYKNEYNVLNIAKYNLYKKSTYYYDYFLNYTFERNINEIIEEKNEEALLSNSLNNSLSKPIKNTNVNDIKKETTKDNEQDKITISEDSEVNRIDNINCNEKIEYNEIKENKKNIKNYNKQNISSSSRTGLFVKKLFENKKDNNKHINNDKYNNKKNIIIQNKSLPFKNDNSSVDCFNASDSCNSSHSGDSYDSDIIKNTNNNQNNEIEKDVAKTPLHVENKNKILEKNNGKIENNKNISKSIGRNYSYNKINLDNRLSQNRYDNCKESIKNIISQILKQKTVVCSPIYYSKHSFQMNNNLSKRNNLTEKNNKIFEFSKTPTGLINSNSKNPKIIKSKSISKEGYNLKGKSLSPLLKNQGILRNNRRVNIKDKNSKITIAGIFNKKCMYDKRSREMSSFNYNKRIMNNNNKKSDEIISSNRISSSNILKHIRQSNYHNKNNINNVNNNQRMKQNNKISVEYKLEEDCQIFIKNNKKNNKNENKSKKRKLNNYFNNNIVNSNNSSININKMKMAMNGKININFVIKGNFNNSNLSKKGEKRGNKNNKKMRRSRSIGFF